MRDFPDPRVKRESLLRDYIAALDDLLLTCNNPSNIIKTLNRIKVVEDYLDGLNWCVNNSALLNILTEKQVTNLLIDQLGLEAND